MNLASLFRRRGQSSALRITTTTLGRTIAPAGDDDDYDGEDDDDIDVEKDDFSCNDFDSCRFVSACHNGGSCENMMFQ